MTPKRYASARGVRRAVLATGLLAAMAAFSPATSHATPAPSPAPAQPGTVEIGGGSGIVFGHGEPVTEAYYWMCTLTTIGYDGEGNLVGLTNAHCFYDTEGNQWPGDEVYFDESQPGTSLEPSSSADPDLETGVIGTVEYISGGNPVVPGPNGVGLDYAVISFDESKVIPTATVGELTIADVGPPPGFGTIMCKQGRTTGLTCGSMLAPSGDYFFHTIWELGGDSGAPVAVGQMLVGNQWVAGGSTSMTAVIDDLNARGGIGAGFTPVAP